MNHVHTLASALLLLVFSMSLSCSSFIKDEHMPPLKKLEKKTYVMKKDVKIAGTLVPKGREVKVVIVAGDDWVKVYSYPADGDKLKAKRTLILYLFEEDFKEKEYRFPVFQKKLAEIAEEKK